LSASSTAVFSLRIPRGGIQPRSSLTASTSVLATVPRPAVASKPTLMPLNVPSATDETSFDSRSVDRRSTVVGAAGALWGDS